ncbi:hypothetical protein AB9L69_23645 [Escherichia coli]|uniref:hypothetical protein n=1 Tax=Escherichia coli TaxID=562 RepID=UPI001932A7F3|nr:hypothetical protein [Escherichia coli]MBL7295827.1 hypothetical protein [Escherichia coli]MDQ8130995.1 hypothetical protein [Escherichia coli]HDL6408774.1 hypothetical protein [Escherichia coli]
MRMFAICRCVAYGYAAHILFSHFFTADPKKAKVGSPDYSRGILANMPDMEAGE